MDEPKMIVDEAKDVERALTRPKIDEEAKYRLAYKLAKRSHKRLARAHYQGERNRQAAGGYCCPRCQTWHPTPEARKACRESHR